MLVFFVDNEKLPSNKIIFPPSSVSKYADSSVSRYTSNLFSVCFIQVVVMLITYLIILWFVVMFGYDYFICFIFGGLVGGDVCCVDNYLKSCPIVFAPIFPINSNPSPVLYKVSPPVVAIGVITLSYKPLTNDPAPPFNLEPVIAF